MIYTAKVHDVIHGDEELHGEAVLVDKLWPRGVAKERLDYDHWFKHVAPSVEPVSYTHLTLPTNREV